MIRNKKILIIGGSGSLGNEIIQRYIKRESNNEIVCFSRDECKHWEMSLKYKEPNLRFIIGDIRDYDRTKITLLRENPNIIIIAAALKHVDRCEYSTSECILTNLVGPQNVIDIIEKHKESLNNLETVCFVSTDKACSPVNVYGMCKALSESLVVEKSFYVKDIKFVCVRYGNVLNSRGSIIPILHEKGKDHETKYFSLTHENMTRFVMTLEQSVNLIEHSIINAETGDIVIPHLVSMKVKDLLEIFSEIYNKPIVTSGLRTGEKMLESLINETQSMRIVKNNGYIHIKPPYLSGILNNNMSDYNSTINPINIDELKKMLTELKLI
jgi:FlaA1/EpsC-like NDP-sugar epimerase